MPTCGPMNRCKSIHGLWRNRPRYYRSDRASRWDWCERRLANRRPRRAAHPASRTANRTVHRLALVNSYSNPVIDLPPNPPAITPTQLARVGRHGRMPEVEDVRPARGANCGIAVFKPRQLGHHHHPLGPVTVGEFSPADLRLPVPAGRYGTIGASCSRFEPALRPPDAGRHRVPRSSDDRLKF